MCKLFKKKEVEAPIKLVVSEPEKVIEYVFVTEEEETHLKSKECCGYCKSCKRGRVDYCFRFEPNFECDKHQISMGLDDIFDHKCDDFDYKEESKYDLIMSHRKNKRLESVNYQKVDKDV